jgi:peptidoglycan/xylan/chitin deacetylase (PgdA/CDA1 family)
MATSAPLRNRSRVAAFLSYHSVADQGPRYLTVAPELFERQLDHYARRGYRSGGLEELSALAAGGSCGANLFLTFDDGYADNYEQALPLIRERGVQAFVFILPPVVEKGGTLLWPEVEDDVKATPETMRSVTWEMVGEMVEGGFEIGSHGLRHASLPALSDEELRQELSDSRRRIAERVGSCETLAYPFGDWDARVAQAAADCGYKLAFTQPTKTGQRLATPLSIPRVNIDYRDEARRLDLKLSAAGRRLLLSPRLTRARRRLAALRSG